MTEWFNRKTLHAARYGLITRGTLMGSDRPSSAHSNRPPGVEVGDLLPALKAAYESGGGAVGAKTSAVHYETGRQLTVTGNTVVAEFLSPMLEQILPERSS